MGASAVAESRVQPTHNFNGARAGHDSQTPGLVASGGLLLLGLSLLACGSSATKPAPQDSSLQTTNAHLVVASGVNPAAVTPSPAPPTSAISTPVAPTPRPSCGLHTAGCPENFTCTEGRCAQGDQVFVPTSTFKMGCNSEHQKPCHPDELPEHTVKLSEFSIDLTEVTVSAYRKCVESKRCSVPSAKGKVDRCTWKEQNNDTLPVSCVTWYQASEYCLSVGRELPTEAQWELAARSPDRRRYPWGNEEPTCERANLFLPPNFCVARPLSVGSIPLGRGPYGTLDQIGNVLEWTRDWYHAKYYYDSAEVDPKGPPQTGSKVLRGSSFSDAIRGGISTSARYYLEPDTSSALIGFRCVKNRL